METKTAFNARTYASREGLNAGAIWIISFLCYVVGLRVPIIGTLSTPIGLLSIFIIGRRIQKIRAEFPDTSYWKMWIVSLQTFMFGTLLTTLAQYIYFRFMDNGVFVEALQKVMASPENQEILKAYQSYDLKEAMEILYKSSVKEITYNLFISNIFISLIFSFPTALIGCVKRRNN